MGFDGEWFNKIVLSSASLIFHADPSFDPIYGRIRLALTCFFVEVSHKNRVWLAGVIVSH